MKWKIKRLIFVVVFSSCSLLVCYNYAYKDFKPYRFIPQDEDSVSKTLQLFDNNLMLVQNNVHICEFKSSDQTSLVINLIVSSRGNFENRQAVRDTIGSRTRYQGWEFRIAFLVGLPSTSTSENTEIEEKLIQEIGSNADIIVGNFEDTYHNLGYKHLLGYKWVLEYCHWADAVVKNDDDVFLNVFQLPAFLSQNVYSGVIHCWEMKGSTPRRLGNDKWKVSEKDYPFDVYPDYCTGAGYIITPCLMKRIYEVRALFKYFWIDDVYVTGLLRSHPKVNADVKIRSIRNRFTFYSNDTERNWDDSNWLFTVLPRKQTAIEEIFYRLWRRITLKSRGSSMRVCEWTMLLGIFGVSMNVYV